jgi:hypothetical protein
VATSVRHPEPSSALPQLRKGRKAKVIGFLGAKGGVGATTVALNTALALGETHAAVLAELGSGNDTFTLRVRTTSKSVWPPGTALDGLWSVKDIPGLRKRWPPNWKPWAPKRISWCSTSARSRHNW